MKQRSFMGRIIAGLVLIVLGSLWCLEARAVHEPAEGAAVGSFMVIGGIFAVRSGVRRRRAAAEVLADPQTHPGGGCYPTMTDEEARAARRAARESALWGRGWTSLSNSPRRGRFRL
jgi:hypothetical protein